MWYDDLGYETIIYGIIIWIVVFFLCKIIFSNRRIFGYSLMYLFFIALAFIIKMVSNNILGDTIFSGTLYLGSLVFVVIAAPDIRDSFENMWSESGKKKALVMGSEKTKNIIIDAVIELSKTQTGALITIEKHNTLDEYSERAITLNSEVSKELLLNIFVSNTPLHDGGVIIRGDKIVCAGAYYILSGNENFNKSSTGSRHRAGLGISEVSDSLTIIVSEETGSISIAIEGIMFKINDREKLNDYLTTFMK